MRGGRETWSLTSSVTLGVFLTSLGFRWFFLGYSYSYNFFFFLAVLGICFYAGFALVAAWGFSLWWLLLLQSTGSRAQAQ